MELKHISSPLITSAGMTSTIMGMDARGNDMALYYLRDKIYTDKIGAVVREYITNALDEHTKHNIDRPVDTGIRYADGGTCEFFVRDYAHGLDEESLRGIFGMYFRSTKSQTNDLTGGFGVGSKAAFCYTDAFTVISYFNGIKTLYACSLGAGDSGIPVGHIYKISEEQTTETGLEVCLDLKGSSYSFVEKIKSFVFTCKRPVRAHINDEYHTPHTPTKTIQRNGFEINIYMVPVRVALHHTSPQQLYPQYRMGDVVYSRSSTTSPVFVNCNVQSVVVDIPIGKMSLPISREGFESTTSNDRVIALIEQTLVSLADEDIPNKDATPLELLADRHQTVSFGEVFCKNKKDMYPTVWGVINNIGRVNKDIPAALAKDATILVALLPDKRTYNDWIDKLSDTATDANKSFYYIKSGHITNPSALTDIDLLNKFFKFKNVRSRVFIPDYGKSTDRDGNVNTSYNVKLRGNGRYGSKTSLTPLELHNTMRKNLRLSEAEDADSAIEQLEDMPEPTSMLELGERSIVLSKSTNLDHCHVTAAKAMFDSMLSLGFYDRNSTDWQNIYNKIHQKQREKDKLDSDIYRATKIPMKDALVTNLRAKLTRTPKHVSKIVALWDKIDQENSLRGKLLKGLNALYHHNAVKLDRQEVRTLLKLK